MKLNFPLSKKTPSFKSILFLLISFLFVNWSQAQIVYSFTNAGATGTSGPTQTQVNAAYTSGNTLYNAVTATSGIQYWTVPYTGDYSLEVAGASGGYTPNAIGGRGRVIKTKIALTAGKVLKILVGQEGGRQYFTTGYAGGGGGGSFVINSTDNTILLISGGGGGGAQGNTSYVSTQNGVDASAYNVTSGQSGTGYSGSWSTVGAGGINGSGGGANAGGSGGGGYSSVGTKGSYGGNAGSSFASGANGGTNLSNCGAATTNIDGGFGGGAGAGMCTSYEANAGGGGGYSGGGGSNSRVGAGGGGGNYFSGIYISDALNTGNGYVKITYLYNAGNIALSDGINQSTEVCTIYTPNTFTSTSLASGGSGAGTYTYQWQISTDNNTWSDINGANSTTYAPGADIITTTYYRRKVTDNTTPVANVAYSNVLSVIIDAIPTSSVAGSNIVLCSGTSTTLAANTAIIGTGTWSRISGPNTPSFSNANSNTATISGLTNGTYVLEWKISTSASVTPPSCAVSTSNINLVVGAPTITSTTGGSTCNPGTATLTAAASAGTINWYSASTGGSSLGTGTSFTTSTLTSTTNFYVDATGSGCTTASRTAVTATVLPNNTITLSSTAGTDAQSKCISTAITNITYNTTGATGATVTGLPTGVTSAWATNVLTISGTPTVAGVFSYTINLTGGCGTITKTGTITVTQASVGTVTGTAATICVGATSTYTATAVVLSGGTGAWSSSNTAVATVNASTGVITGVGAGTATITYTITGGCGGTISSAKSITINAIPSLTATIGATTICSVGSSATLSNTTVGGVWSSSNTSIATVDAYGVVTGIALGTSTITYAITDLNACTNTVNTVISVSALPTTPSALVANPATLCNAGTAILTATSTGNLINWYNVSTGGSVLSTVASGANYTTPSISSNTTFYAEAAYNSTQTFNYTGAVQTFVVPNNITSIDIETWGAQGGSPQASVGGKGGYAKGTLTVTPGETLNIYVGGKGLAGTTAVLLNGGFNGGGYTYAYTSGAYAGSGGGATDIRRGGTALSNRVIVAGAGGGSGYYSATAYSGGSGGGTSGNTGTISYGYNGGGGGSQVAGGVAGTTSSYSQAGSLGLGGNSTAISGNWNGSGGGGGYYGGGSGAAVGAGGGGGSSYIGGVNAGQTIAGNASMPNPAGGASIIGNTGDGVVKISFVSNPCLSPRVPITVNMSAAANAGTLTGTATICVGATSTYTSTNFVMAGGIGAWSSSNTAVATVNATTGVINGVSAGTASITYTITGGCGGTASAQKLVTVKALPTVGAITGSTTICDVNGTATLTNATLGGVWSSSNSNIATINASGVITGVSFGNASVTYTVTNSDGCVMSTMSNIIVSALPATPTNVTATPATLCSGSITVLNAVSTGNVINWYTVSTGGTSLSTVASGANYTPTAITSAKTFYAEAAYNTVQSFSYTGAVQDFAVPNNVNSITIEAWGAQGGTGWINGSIGSGIGGNGGYSKGTLTVTPGETLKIYVGGKGGSAKDFSAGGWNGGGSSDDNDTDNDDSGGGGGGATDVRQGGTALSNRVIVAGGGGGGGCNSGNGGGGGGASGIAGTGTTGGIAGTQSTGSSLGNGENVTTATTSGGGVTGGGGGGYYGGYGGRSSYSTGGGGGSAYLGTLTSAQTIAGNASMPNPAGGTNITGKTGDGVVLITMASNPCLSPRVPIVVSLSASASVAAVTGNATVCIGSTATYTATSVVLAGGTGAWSSSNTAVATVNATTGVLTSVGLGTTNIVYTISGGCGSATAQKTITVSALPVVASITGNSVLCNVGASGTLNNATLGGVWSSTNNAIATIADDGSVSAIAIGSTNISYVVTDINSCTNSVTTNLVVSALPATPTNVTATPATLCSGSNTVLNAVSTGNVINWYTASTGGTILSTVASGENYTPTAITSGKTFYAEAAYSSTQTFNYTGGTQTYTVPNGVTSITFDVFGARGGNNTTITSYSGGYGARAKSTISVTPGEVLTILVGGKGGDYSCGAGGGGGSFVVNASNTPLVIAGGGGGAFYCSALGGSNGGSGLTTTSGGDGIPVASGRSGRVGGANGNGGSAYYGGGGGGFYSAGVASMTAANAGKMYPGASVTGGGTGGYGGGGAGYVSCCGAAGGGGGYSGGSSGTGDGVAGGGGGSYIIGTGINNVQTAGVNSGNGYVIITSASSNNCLSPRVPIVVSLSPSASVAAVTGNATLCVGSTATYTATSVVLAGGTGAWSSSNTAVATVNATTGVITALTAGTSTITYSISGGCGTATAQKQITVNALPVLTAISGATTICKNATTTFTNTTSGGIWTSTNASIATITNTGVITGVASGTVNMNYTYTNSNACSATVSKTIIIAGLPADPSALTATPNTLLSGSITSLSAVSTGNKIAWYDVATGGTALTTINSGASYTSTVNYTTTYYAEANITVAPSVVCISENRIPIIVTVANMSTLTTAAISSIGLTTANTGGIISNDGGTPITSRGVCWSTSTNPTIANSKTVDGTGTGTFASSITGLLNGTTYYVRAYATNAISTSYGAQYSFTTLTVPVITSFTPTTAGKNVPVTITGANFNDVQTVQFGGTNATSFTINSSTSITALPATGASGDITITSPGGTASKTSFTYMAGPSLQASSIVVSGLTNTQATISWSNGNGSKRVVFMTANTSGTASPDPGVTYTANTIYTNGTQVGTSGWYCVYNGIGSSVNVSGLTPMTTYRIMVIEYNGASAAEVYYNNAYTGNPINTTTLGPTITTNASTLNTFSNCIGTASARQIIVVSGQYLTSNMTINAPSGFEISTTDGSNYTSAITLTQSGGTITNTNIYVRVTNLATGTISGTVSFASTNAITKSVAVSGTVSELSVAGLISGNASVCIGTNSTDLLLTGNTGAIQWRQSNNNSTYTDILNATSNTLTVNNLTSTTYYKAFVTNGVCSTASSSVFTITANNNPVSATLNLSSPVGAICVGTNISASIANAGTGGAGTVTDVMQYQYDGGVWNTYTINSNLTTVGHNDIAIKSIRTVTGSGCSVATPNIYTWTVNQTPSIITHPSTTVRAVCQNANAPSLNVVATGASLTYQWYKNTSNSNTGGTAITGATSSTYTPSTTNAGTYYYYVVVAGTCAPNVTSNVSGLYTISGLPTITVQPSTGTQSICLNGTATDLTVTATGGGLTYQWYENTSNNNTNGTLIVGATSPTYKPLTNMVGVKYYYVKIAGTCSPDVVSNTTGAIQTNAIPSVQISQGTTLSLGANGTIRLTANASSGTPTYSYQWYKAGVEVSATPNSSNVYNLNYDVPSVGAYTVKVTDVNGCNYTSQQTNIQALPTMSQIGSDEICAGASVTFVFDATSLDPNGLEWQSSVDNATWYPIQNGLVENGGIAAVQKYTVVNTGFYRLAYTNAGNTTYTTASDVTVYENPIVTITPSVSLVNLCTNTALSLSSSVSLAGTYTYTWTSNGSIVGSASQLAINSNGVYKIKMTDSHGCFGEATSDQVLFNPLPTATIQGSTVVCEASSSPQIVFTGASASSPYTFKYNINGATVVETAAGVNTLSVPTNDPGTYTYNLVGVKDAIGCYQALNSSATVTINPLPSIALGTIDPISMASTNAILPFSNSLNNPSNYAITTGTRSLQNYVNVTAAALNGSSINVIVPPSAAGTYDFNLSTVNTSTGCRSTVYPFELTIVAPNVTIVGTLNALSTNYGSASTTTRFKVAGTYLVSDLTLTAPTGFEISKSINSGFASSLVISPTNETLANTFIYVRLKATAQVANSPYSGNIVISANSMTSINVPIPSSTINAVPLQISGISIPDKLYDGADAAQITGMPVYIGLQNNESLSVTGSATALFADANVGINKTIIVAGFTSPNSNYNIVQPTNLTANIQKAHLVITAIGQSVQEGTSDLVVIAQAASNITGFVHNENSSVITGAIVYTTTYTANAIVGTASLTLSPDVSGLTANNYDFNAVDGSIIVTINPTSYVTVIGNNSFVYNANSQGPANATVSGSTGLVTYSYSGRLGTVYGPSATAPTAVGNYQVVANLAADQVYHAATSPAYTFAISKKQLALRTRNKNVNYGSTTNSVLNNVLYDYDGLVGNDNAVSITGNVLFTTNYLASTTVGATGILISPNISQLSSNNYDITAYAGNINVVDVVPTLAYATNTYSLTKNTLIQPIAPTSTGTNLHFSAPVLPAGLTINTTTGVITGTPIVTNTTANNYTVTVNNTAGQVSSILTITVLPDQPQGSIALRDRAIMATDSVVLKFNFTQGIAPYNAIVFNTVMNKYDTLYNLTNGQFIKLKPVSQSTVFQLKQLSDANNTYRNSAFDNDTASLQILVPKMAMLLSSNTPVMYPDSTYRLQLSLKLKNNGQVGLNNLQVDADLNKLFAAGYNYTIDSVVVQSGTMRINPSYTGKGSSNVINSILTKGASQKQYIKSMTTLLGNYLFDNNASLAVGEEALINLNFSLPKTKTNVPAALQFSYTALANLPLSNNEVSSQVVGALSQDSKPNAILLDTITVPTVITLLPRPLLASSLYVSSATVVPQGYEFHFKGKIANLGNTNMDSIHVVYSLKNAFRNPDTAFLKAPPTITRGDIIYNATKYDGYLNDTLVDHSGYLPYGDSIIIDFDVAVRTNKLSATWLNDIKVIALSTLDRQMITDSSVSGLMVDPNNDGLPDEASFTRATVNFVSPIAPTVNNATYLYQSVPFNSIKSLVKTYPIGTIPVWCDAITSRCDTIAPILPTAIGKYVYEVRAYDSASLLYSNIAAYDTVIVKPLKPIVTDARYIIGLSTNPSNVQSQVMGSVGSAIKYYVSNASTYTAPLLAGLSKGKHKIYTSQVINTIESDTIAFNVEMLNMTDVLGIQKTVASPKITTNSSFDIEYALLLSNLIDIKIDSISLKDALKDQYPAGIDYSVKSISATGATLKANPSYNGSMNNNLLLTTSYLAPLQRDTIKFIVNVNPHSFSGDLSSLATVTAKSALGLLNLQSTNVIATIPEIGVIVPAGFSPNNDGIDDKWIIVRPYGTTISVQVFNRWGAEVFSDSNYQNTWDGRGVRNFMGEIVAEGTYFYVVEIKDNNGISRKLTGSLTIAK